MAYETDHVRLVDDVEGGITGISTFAALVENPDLAELYTVLRGSEMSAPELVDRVGVSKKTVYSYLADLERAGLASETARDGEAAVYRAEGFELTVRLGGVEVSVTPDLVDVFARGTEVSVIERVRDDRGVVPLALAYDLVHDHAAGEVTIREIAQLTGLPTGTTYDLVTALYDILELGADGEAPTTFTPDDVGGGDDITGRLVDE